MRSYGFTITEHDPARPWIIVGSRHESVQLDESTSFFEWAEERWPRERFTVQLDPWEIAPHWPTAGQGPG